MLCTICDIYLGTASSLRLTEHGPDSHLASISNLKAVGMAEAAVTADEVPRAYHAANCNGSAMANTAER